MEELFDFDWSEQKSENCLEAEGRSEQRTRSATPPVSHPGEIDFDYKTYILKELSQFDTANMEPVVKKKLVQKIRNRMSAQRSRQKAKGLLERLQEENTQLKNELFQARTHINVLQAELDTLKGSPSAINEAGLLDSPVPRFYRDHSPLASPMRSFFVALLAVVCLLFVSFGAAGERSATLKLGGVLPSLADSLLPSSRQLSTIRETCNIYCKDVLAPTCDPPLSTPSVLSAEPSTAIAQMAEPKMSVLYCQTYPRMADKNILVLHASPLLGDIPAYYSPELQPLLLERKEGPLPAQ